MQLPQTARRIADEEAGISGRKAKRIFDGLNKVVKREEYDAEILKNSEGDLTDRNYLEGAIKRTLSYLAPEYLSPTPLVFRPEMIPGFGIRYETNIDFSEANLHFHPRVPAKDASLTPAYLLAQITSAEPDIVVVSRNSSEFAVDPFKSLIVSSRVAEVIRKSTVGKEKLEAFQEVVVDECRSIREAVNSGDRTFRDVIRLLEKAQKFKEWIQKRNEDSRLRDDYCKSVASVDWADRLPRKALRFVVMNGLSTLAGHAMTPEAGVAIGIGLNTADYFLLDRLLKGWKPNQFVEGSLKPFVKRS